jgi:hypothetical protein
MMNTTVTETGVINFYNEDHTAIKYSMTINTDGVGSRALHYARSYTGGSIDETLRPVIYIPPVVEESNPNAGGGSGSSSSSVNTNITCIPLYECISPSISKKMAGTMQLTWWTNTDGVLTKDEGSDDYVYDYSKIKKFYTTQLGDIEDTTNCSKILCTASLQWERLQQDGVDDMVYNVPVIRDIAILACISGEGYIVDFSTGGGGGGGNKIHSHLNTQDCGFAGAVFMPSATPRVMSWM